MEVIIGTHKIQETQCKAKQMIPRWNLKRDSKTKRHKK